MTTDRITYKQLDALLTHLEFSRTHVEPKWLRYEDASSDTWIFLVDKKPDEIVRVTDAFSARHLVVEKGLISEEEMESIFSQNAPEQKTVSATKT